MKTKKIGQNNVLTFNQEGKEIKVDSTLLDQEPIYNEPTLDTEYADYQMKFINKMFKNHFNTD